MVLTCDSGADLHTPSMIPMGNKPSLEATRADRTMYPALYHARELLHKG